MADYLAARFALRPTELKLFDRSVTFAHIVVAKSQQVVEKVTKGYLLWHSRSFDPTKGHDPLTNILEDQPASWPKAGEHLIQALNRASDRMIVREIKWLESLAPKVPAAADPGRPQPLNIIPENTEYPFWTVAAKGRLVVPAEGITLLGHGVRAFKTARTYLDTLARSDPQDYTRPIRDFLATYSLGTEIIEWPPIDT